MMTATAVAFDKVLPLWTWIRENVDRARAHSGDYWLVEDVYAALKFGHATMVLVHNKGELAGGAVVRLEPDQNHERIMYVWAAWLDDGSFADAVTVVGTLAREAQCRAMRFASARPGWQKRAKLLSATYEIEVPHGQ